MRLITFILLCGFFLPKQVASQQLTIIPDLRFENFNSQRNFTSGYIGNIVSDKKGYIWAASNGLFRFDGVRFDQYTNFNNQYHGLRSNYCDDLVVDPAGRLWIGNGLGLCYYNDTLGRFDYVNKDEKTPINYAYSFYPDGNRMWFISNLGLSNIDTRTFKIHQTALKEFPDPITTFPLDSGLLGISGRTGLFIYDPRTDTYSKKVYRHEGNILRIRQCIYMNGKYWTATNRGLWEMGNNGDQLNLVMGSQHLNISSIAFHPGDNKNQYIWLGTTNNGLQLLNTNTGKMEYSFYHDNDNPNSLQSNNITSMHFDNLGRLWMGTEDGISMFDYLNQSWKTRKMNFREGITADNEIRKIIPDRFDSSRVWMSCINQGILLIDWETKELIHHYKNFPAAYSLSFSDLHQLDDSKWVLMGRNKLITWDPETNKIRDAGPIPVETSLPVNLEFTSLIPIASDSIYVTSSAGLYLFDPTKNKVQHILKRTGPDIYSTLDLIFGIHMKETIWIASRKGLVSYNIRNNSSSSYSNPYGDTTTGNYLTHLALTPDDQVLCASISGVGVFNIKSRSYNMINEFGSIRNPSCFAIHVRDTIAWINSNAGLLQYNLKTRKTLASEITRKTNFFTPVRFGVVDDELVLGYRNQYSYFNPMLLGKPELPLNPVIEKILLNNEPIYNISSDGKLNKFRHTQNSFTFYFTAFEFHNPGNIQFRYKLEGQDQDWNYQNEQRNATYIGLPPGKYEFIVQAGNFQGEWNTSTAVFRMHIIPPFWQQWWFWPLIALFFVMIVIFMARKRINTIRVREQEKTAINKSMAELETHLLRSQMNPHFIFNSLNSIQKYIWENKEEDAAEYLARFAKLIRGILENSRKETVPLNEELEMMKLYVDLEHRRSNGKFEYVIKTGETLQTSKIMVPPMLLQPFIENAIWHGLNKKEGSGHLHISVKQVDNYLECIIDDDGVGRKTAVENKSTTGKQSLGIEITRQRVELLRQSSDQRADIRITDKMENGISQGTCVIVTIPIQIKKV